ncbi:hypothetical protein amb2037 [Paramagnetospirillum magneticum AMB-1]|uniref:Uncharacterized protein n=1 Tax=Paramagnetospirillum magneticum (strain ATCC 700264 / AMB-1) TaxID=342108 RepID=Q2W5N4_PARM1|nr:hypothetical protein amb2037 [Paramagnetospirillum magneticum AMB-1]
MALADNVFSSNFLGDLGLTAFWNQQHIALPNAVRQLAFRHLPHPPLCSPNRCCWIGRIAAD